MSDVTTWYGSIHECHRSFTRRLQFAVTVANNSVIGQTPSSKTDVSYALEVDQRQGAILRNK